MDGNEQGQGAGDESGPRTLATTGGEHATTTAAPELAATLPARPGGDAAATRTRIGRYHIVRQLGQGGMGIVWEATDPELGRRVAIKLLHEARAGNLRLAERLRREAQALARLSHPNVTAVYDVGVDDGELYLVMQLVDGVTLDRALATRRSPRDRIALLVAAGRGLEAAHAAGIVHRDFKPTNVLVDTGGTPRVTDFGLARASEAVDEADPEATGGALELSMTRGELVGTPAYMAPEQFLGGPVTHATDQFAFCVTLWEALAGERPFAGRDVTSLREAVVAGKRRELPAGVPRHVRAVLVRGLATDPAARWRSMTALLDELSPQRRILWIAAGVGVAAIATTAILLGATRTQADPCATIGEPADVVWNDGQRGALRGTLGALGTPIVTQLDARTARWKAQRVDACQTTRDPGSRELLERRYLCLERSLADERAAVELLAGTPDRALLARAREIAASGRDPDDCTRERVTARTVSKRTPASEALYAEVSRLLPLYNAGRPREVLAQIATLEPRVIAADDPSIAARWFFAVGLAQQSNGELAAAQASLRRAAEAGTRAGEDDVAAEAWSELAQTSAEMGDLKNIDDLLAIARGAAARAGTPHAQMLYEIANGRVATERGQFPAAVTACQRAIDLAGKLADQPRMRLRGWSCLLETQLDSGDMPGAKATAQRAIEVTTQLDGADHPDNFELELRLAGALLSTGDKAAAKTRFAHALAGYERWYGPRSPQLMRALRDYAVAQSPGGAVSTPEALAAIKRAVAIADEVLPAKDPMHAGMLEALAYVESASGDHEAANQAWRRAIQLYEGLDDPMGFARVLYNAGDELKNGSRCELAVPLFRRAAQTAAQTGQKSLMQAASLGSIGACLGASKQWADAEQALTEAIDQLDALGNVIFAAQNRWELGDQLIKRGQRARGLALSKAAADQLASQPPPAPELRAQILAWIAKQ